jgi:ferritin-like protein
MAEPVERRSFREYQAIIALRSLFAGAQRRGIHGYRRPARNPRQAGTRSCPDPLEADRFSRQMPVVTPKPVRTSKNARDMLRYDLDNENETIRNYRDCIPQCEALGEYAMAEQIREILVQEQDHQIDLATALGEDVPDVNAGPQRRSLRMR